MLWIEYLVKTVDTHEVELLDLPWTALLCPVEYPQPHWLHWQRKTLVYKSKHVLLCVGKNAKISPVSARHFCPHNTGPVPHLVKTLSSLMLTNRFDLWLHLCCSYKGTLANLLLYTAIEPGPIKFEKGEERGERINHSLPKSIKLIYLII